MAEWIVEIVDGNPNIKKMIPLVRCKDCKHWNYDAIFKQGWCNGVERSADFYCKDGERRKRDVERK